MNYLEIVLDIIQIIISVFAMSYTIKILHQLRKEGDS